MSSPQITRMFGFPCGTRPPPMDDRTIPTSRVAWRSVHLGAPDRRVAGAQNDPDRGTRESRRLGATWLRGGQTGSAAHSAPDHHTRSTGRAVLRARLRPSPRMAPGERRGLVRQVDMNLGVGETAGVGRREDATLPGGDFTLNPNTPTVDVLVGRSHSTARARTKRHRTARSARDLNSDRRGPRVSASAQRVPPGQVFSDSPCLTVLWITGSPLPVREKVR